MNRLSSSALGLPLLLALVTTGCAFEADSSERPGVSLKLSDPPAPLTRRRNAVVMEGCILDTWQRASLEAPAARHLVQEVVLLCPALRTSGEVDPVDDSARRAVAQTVADLRLQGYRVFLGVTFADPLDTPYAPDALLGALSDGAFRDRAASALLTWSSLADGVELAFFSLPSEARPHLTSLVGAVSAAFRGRSTTPHLGLFVPPSVQSPSDVPGGDAFDVTALAPFVDRLRLMTVDFSCCHPPGGPTTEPGWAVDVLRFHRAKVGTFPVDVTFPLYGHDFGPHGDRPVTYLEATALAATTGALPARGPTQALHFDYLDGLGLPHTLWYDDALSSEIALRSWDAALPGDVGVLFYGLGAEDPLLFPRLARAVP